MTGWEDLAAIGAVTRAMDDLRDFREKETAQDIRDAFDDALDYLNYVNMKLHQCIRSRESGPPIGVISDS